MLATSQRSSSSHRALSWTEVSEQCPEGLAGLHELCALPSAAWFTLCSPWTLVSNVLYTMRWGWGSKRPLGQVLPGFYYPSFKLLKWLANDLTLWNGVKPFQNQSLSPDLHSTPPNTEDWLLYSTTRGHWGFTLLLGTCFWNTELVSELKCCREVTTGQDQQPRWDCMSRYNHCLQFATWRVGFNKGYYFKYRGKSQWAQVCSLFLKRPILVKCQWYYLVFYIIYHVLN